MTCSKSGRICGMKVVNSSEVHCRAPAILTRAKPSILAKVRICHHLGIGALHDVRSFKTSAGGVGILLVCEQ